MSTITTDLDRDLAALEDALSDFNAIFWVPVIAGFAWAGLPRRRTARGRTWRGLLVLALAAPLPILEWRDHLAYQDFKARQRVAEAHFRKRCESAGEFIHRRVQGVESIWWMKRRKLSDLDTTSQYGTRGMQDWGRLRDGRQPWAFATRDSCPPLHTDPKRTTYVDIDRTLKLFVKSCP